MPIDNILSLNRVAVREWFEQVWLQALPIQNVSEY